MVLAFHSASIFAQNLPYGAPINLETAKKVVQAASAEMHKKNLELTIVVVDSGGNLVYLERADQAPIGTVDAAIGKGAFPIEGGVPLISNNQIIGAIGASGAMPVDDGTVANAGARSLKP